MVIREEILTSRQNPTVKWVASLREKKERDEARAFLADGEKLTFEAIETGLPVLNLFVREDKKEKIFSRLSTYENSPALADCTVTVVSEGVFEKISSEISPQGVISVIKYLDFFRDLDIIYKEDFFGPGKYSAKSDRMIVLCSLRDPGNLGSVIRSAVAFGVDHIVLTADCADVYNPKTVRSAMGSLFHVKVTAVRDITSFIAAAAEEGRRTFAAELSPCAVSVVDSDLSSRDVVIIGNEGHGIPEEISGACAGSLYIPISEKTESLNASVAAALFMWEQSKK